MSPTSSTVSVIIPAYNQASFVGQAIDSVLAQSYTDYEIIVVNDGSTDETAQVLAGYGDRVRVVTQDNAGLSAARNNGMRVARGEMVAFLDSDDLWCPNMLQSTVSHLLENPSADLVCGAWDYIDENGNPIAAVSKPSSHYLEVTRDSLRALVLGTLFPVHALLLRRTCIEVCGGFDVTLRAMEDWDMWLRMAARGFRMAFIDLPVARYRRHRGCMTLEPQRMEQAFHQVLGKLFSDECASRHLADLQCHAYLIQWLYIASYCEEAGQNVDARKCLQKAQELYASAPANPSLNRRYLSMASKLQEGDAMSRAVVAGEPGLMPSYRWLAFRGFLRHRQYRRAFLSLFGIFVTRPEWLAEKTISRIARISVFAENRDVCP